MKNRQTSLDLLLEQKKVIKNDQIIVDLRKTKYDVIRDVTSAFGYQEDKSQAWNLRWTDSYVIDLDLKRLLPFQRINGFPSSHELCSKNNLAKNLQRMQDKFPDDYDFFPKTFILTGQSEQLKQFQKQNKKQYFIVKPYSSCQGRGIQLTKHINQEKDSIVQQYIINPYLIGNLSYQDELKFDLRIYVLIKSVTNLEIYIFKEGLARFSCEKYQKPNNQNCQNQFMHLTNYSVNRYHSNFNYNKMKRPLTAVLEHLKEEGHDTDKLMKDIKQIILKTMVSVQPQLSKVYQMCRPKDSELELCFEILGFDIMIDSNLKPWLIEVNHSPSFATESKIDKTVKQNLITDTLILLNLQNKEKKMYKLKEEIVIRYIQLGNFLIANENFSQDLCVIPMFNENFHKLTEISQLSVSYKTIFLPLQQLSVYLIFRFNKRRRFLKLPTQISQELIQKRDQEKQIQYENENLNGFEKVYPLSPISNLTIEHFLSWIREEVKAQKVPKQINQQIISKQQTQSLRPKSSKIQQSPRYLQSYEKERLFIKLQSEKKVTPTQQQKRPQTSKNLETQNFRMQTQDKYIPLKSLPKKVEVKHKDNFFDLKYHLMLISRQNRTQKNFKQVTNQMYNNISLHSNFLIVGNKCRKLGYNTYENA